MEAPGVWAELLALPPSVTLSASLLPPCASPACTVQTRNIARPSIRCWPGLDCGLLTEEK